MDSTEDNKTLAGVEQIIQFLQQHQADRQSTLIAIGGGSLLDLVGFSASIYMRGITWWAVPTTLLSMVDASVGGKTAVNLNNTKNLIGSFHPPRKTIIDQTFLNSLPPENYASGMVEVIKMAWTSDAKAWKTEKFYNKENIVPYAIDLKLKIINNDWFENSANKDRLILNAGHTFGHAFEKLYPHLSHGQAVALGLIAEHDFATHFTQSSHPIDQLQQAFSHIGLETNYKKYLTDVDKLIDLMLKDKKSQQQMLQFIVAKAPGQPYCLRCKADDIRTFVSENVS
ncbi:3-dehydroquinate synthase [Candidatus Paracaedibacter acanthamoebae]|uniref:3-dehydroquinate synthase n=1 Tax=Candidatus Odyssella acanthamoebae TaxID=91604 RepID=UPI000AF84A1D|nr:3-dehydroquinate synthase family protein [Candidatus Paracaedibacter acanthamoebae]